MSLLKDIWTIEEASTEVHRNIETIRQAIKDGKIAGRKSGGTWLLMRQDAETRWPEGGGPARGRPWPRKEDKPE